MSTKKSAYVKMYNYKCALNIMLQDSTSNMLGPPVISMRPITFQQLNAFSHADTVKITC